MECDETIRLNILVRGTVQRVGYRHLIQGIARKHHITGQITNLEGYDVQIIAEGRYNDLSRFKTDIKIQEHPVYVESIEVLEGAYTGEYSYFNVVRGTPEEELAERLDSAIAIFSRMEKKQDYSIGLQKETLGLQNETIVLQKETLGLQKDTIGLQKETVGFQKETLGLQRETLGLQKETLGEVKGIRQDLNKTLTQEIAEVRIELREMRSALIQAGIMKSVHS
ncbi:MAG: hypothetical protein CVV33_06635 [Methanomicrobiales archaeon HGW-Methanomicrobiales-4]|nr:MAG: hypothetical protein CVV33_06635 [Methanomicrobiales archaeon HGW-Methanomicrobiales-4]